MIQLIAHMPLVSTLNMKVLFSFLFFSDILFIVLEYLLKWETDLYVYVISEWKSKFTRKTFEYKTRI